MSKTESADILSLLMDRVPAGSLTTYGDLSAWAFGNTGSAQAIVAMLNAAVNANAANAVYTNRVVKKDGTIVDVNGQLNQLRGEGIRVVDGRADLNGTKVVRFTGDA